MNMPLVRMVRPSFAVAALAVILAIPAPTFAARAYQYLKQRDAWFETADARRIADNILTWQAPAGDWPKNGDTVTQPYRGQTNELHGTFDNAATTGEIRFLARAFNATHDARYRTATLRAIDHILAAQYPNGGEAYNAAIKACRDNYNAAMRNVAQCRATCKTQYDNCVGGGYGEQVP